MKMKAVCEATGLSDRTIRYYIEEELILPDYTENYLGRRTFDFSESDIRTLNDIAILRKFGFSIAEIKQMLLYPEEIIPITLALQERKQTIINEEQALLQTLLRLDVQHSYTVTELAAFLSTPVINTPVPMEDQKGNILGVILNFIKTTIVFAATWLPLSLSILVVITNIHDYHYPVFCPFYIFITLCSLLPTFLTLFLPKINTTAKIKAITKKILFILCIVSIPVSALMSFGIVLHSETTDFKNYRDLDPDCLANRSNLFQALFPIWPHYFVNEQSSDGSWNTTYLDAHYYYQYFLGMDYTYDIFAEWPLEKESFDEEVSRVKAVFEEYAALPYSNYLILQKENYTCLIIYQGTPPFEEATINYTYGIFAYDEKNLKVRYYYGSSLENGSDQPYYLSLDW